MPQTHQEELKEASDKILNSSPPKKLIVAGPGTGKTHIFSQLIMALKSTPESQVVLTFINTLKADLTVSLSSLSRVYTFHGYCHYLLRKHPEIRDALTEKFRYYPVLAALIFADWRVAKETKPPQIVGLMRDLQEHESVEFFLERANYYDAISFDDSVYRVYKRFQARPGLIQAYKLVLIDEFQDFNRLEAEFIQQLASQNPIVIAGDDDQALYGQLRAASHEFIRNLFTGNEYEKHNLPFCMRCPEVIVGAVNDVIAQAKKLGLLKGRIEKPFKHFPPVKGEDSKQYPKIQVAQCTVQSKKSNYFGKYIVEAISVIPAAEVKESHEKNFPTVLVIGPKQYLRQIKEFLDKQGYSPEVSSGEPDFEPHRLDGLRFLSEDHCSNLGWRIILETDKPDCYENTIRESVKTRTPLCDLIPETFRTSIMTEIKDFESPPEETVEAVVVDDTKPMIKLTSFEGSKGLSAQHVFIVGLQKNEMPKQVASVKDIEICKFLVALTRTRKQCHLLTTSRFGANQKKPSIFLAWIASSRKQLHRIDSKYWAAKEGVK
jgi:superfamily I DNA/RNA helicase